MKRIIMLIFSISLLFPACEMIEYHPYDGNITGETGINDKNIARIETACKDKPAIKFIMMSDTQGQYEATKDFVNTINQKDDIDFVIHGGDISDFGLTKEFLWMRDIMNKLRVPYVVIVGNHDCVATGLYVFRKVFGELNFSFIAGRTKFVCLNTNALEFDYSQSVPDLQFIKKELESRSDEYEKTVVAMHAPPFSDQFNNNVADVFQDNIKKFPQLQFCLNGHEHTLKATDPFGDNVLYFVPPNIGQRKYWLFTLNENNTYDYEAVEF
jgi:Icc-related predicted phosphoesterase